MSYTGNFENDFATFSKNIETFIKSEYEKFENLEYPFYKLCELMLIPLHAFIGKEIVSLNLEFDNNEKISKEEKEKLKAYIKNITNYHRDIILEILR